MKIEFIQEEWYILDYLTKRRLVPQYKKAKSFLLSWYMSQVHFKLREPKKDKIYYFRINKQFRALCHFEGTTLVVFQIDNHQN